MKVIKKMSSLAIAAAMCAAMSVPVFAATADEASVL